MQESNCHLFQYQKLIDFYAYELNAIEIERGKFLFLELLPDCVRTCVLYTKPHTLPNACLTHSTTKIVSLLTHIQNDTYIGIVLRSNTHLLFPCLIEFRRLDGIRATSTCTAVTFRDSAITMLVIVTVQKNVICTLVIFHGQFSTGITWLTRNHCIEIALILAIT